MADSKITALTALTAADPVNDMFPVVDVSDTSMAASGTTKKISVNNILSSSPTASGALTVTGLVTAGSATITGDLTVDTSTLKVDSTNDRVGIGTATPGVRVDILSDNNTSLAAVLRVNSNNAAVSTSIAYDGVVASTGLTLQSGTSSSIVFNTNGANEAGRINTTGVYVLKGGTTTANGVGVAFPATQVASSDANCLDDYEEGTFTPSIGGTATYTAQTGTYTKVGRLVTASFDITILLRGTGDVAIVSGLPFAASANVGAAVAISYFSTLANSSASIYGYVNSSTMAFNTIAAGGGTSFSGAAVITNATRLAGTAVYMV
jgi:hypothetical protein